MDVAINLPQEFVLFEGVIKVQQEVKTSYALWLFRHHRVTIAKAASLADMSIYEFMQRCHEEQIAVIDIDKERLLEEVHGSEKKIKRRPHPLLQGSVIKADGLMASTEITELITEGNNCEYFQQLRQQPSVVISPEVDIDALMQEMNDGLCVDEKGLTTPSGVA